jgi:hypothetical protein
MGEAQGTGFVMGALSHRTSAFRGSVLEAHPSATIVFILVQRTTLHYGYDPSYPLTPPTLSPPLAHTTYEPPSVR